MPSNWISLLRWGLTIAGAIVVAFSLAIDFILPGLSPGLGPLQISLILVGIALMIFPQLRVSVVGRVLIVVGTVLGMVILLEVLLIALGYTTDYDAVPPSLTPGEIVRLDWVQCDERGCHYNPQPERETCDQADRRDSRTCHLNADGFNSQHEFTSERAQSADYRILVLGDSFTFGAAADYGRGWVRVMEEALQTVDGEVLVWNVAMPGTGTRNAQVAAAYYMPRLQPDLVILGFHTGNDFHDNLYPIDRFMTYRIDGEETALVQQYTRVGDDILRESDDILYYRAKGYNVSSTTDVPAILHQLTRTRLGTLAVGAYQRLQLLRETYDITQDLLATLEQAVRDQGAPLLVLVIPERADATNAGRLYLNALDILQTLDIAYVDPLPLLEDADYTRPNTADEHWNNDAHAKAGALMGDCVREIIAQGGLPCTQMATE